MRYKFTFLADRKQLRRTRTDRCRNRFRPFCYYSRVSVRRGSRGSRWLCHCGLAGAARVGNGGVAGGNAYTAMVERGKEREKVGRNEEVRKGEKELRLVAREGCIMQRASSWQGVDFVQHYVSLPFGFSPLHSPSPLSVTLLLFVPVLMHTVICMRDRAGRVRNHFRRIMKYPLCSFHCYNADR